VIAAAAEGGLAPERLASYQRLRAEMDQVEADRAPAARRASKRAARGADRALKAQPKRKYD
jgi:hypothetical protein